MNLIFIEADLDNSIHGEAIVFLLNSYAKDLKGFG